MLRPNFLAVVRLTVSPIKTFFTRFRLSLPISFFKVRNLLIKTWCVLIVFYHTISAFNNLHTVWPSHVANKYEHWMKIKNFIKWMHGHFREVSSLSIEKFSQNKKKQHLSNWKLIAFPTWQFAEQLFQLSF